MKLPSETDEQTLETICKSIGKRAGNIFRTRQLWCSGAVLVTLNKGFDGDLTQDQAIRLAAGLGDGMGGAQCICGGLNGGALAMGLFLGNGRLSPGGDQIVLEATRWLHDQFKLIHGSTCCRVLLNKDISSANPKHQACAARTASAAALCAEGILTRRPALIEKVNWDYLNQKDSRVGAHLKIMADNLLK